MAWDLSPTVPTSIVLCSTKTKRGCQVSMAQCHDSPLKLLSLSQFPTGANTDFLSFFFIVVDFVIH